MTKPILMMPTELNAEAMEKLARALEPNAWAAYDADESEEWDCLSSLKQARLLLRTYPAIEGVICGTPPVTIAESIIEENYIRGLCPPIWEEKYREMSVKVIMFLLEEPGITSAYIRTEKLRVDVGTEEAKTLERVLNHRLKKVTIKKIAGRATTYRLYANWAARLKKSGK
jgi:hypothetical protein